MPTQKPLSGNPQLKMLRWRLLLSSLSVIACTLTAFGVVVYQVVAHSLGQKADRQLEVLADAAAHSLTDIAANRAAIANRQLRSLDNDGDLDIPWQDLQQDEQSIEWFDAKGTLLGQAGKQFPNEPFRRHATSFESHITAEDGTERDDLHVLTLPVYTTLPNSKPNAKTKVLEGYVRVSESQQATEEELDRLRSGLQWGSLLALILSGIGGGWLTRQSLQPIERNILQLKQFTADASHELRNPLAAIKTSVEVMQTHPERFQPSDLNKLGAIASAADQMSKLVDDLLWLARTDRDSTPPNTLTTIPLEELLEDVLDQYLPQAEQKQITLQAQFKTDGSVLGDAYQLKRLFSNLIANALQYTPPGGKVTVSVFEEDDWLIVRVEDTGIGIAPEHLPFVFDRFWRADQARVQRQGGSGLGMAIAQAIAHQHRGIITVTSKLGQGSCFQVDLPEA